MQATTATSPAGSLVGDYVALTKPTILLTVLVTGLPALLMAGHGLVAPGLAVATLGGTALASASAGAINHFMDRDIDAVMARTMRRPLPSGRVDPRMALVFGLLLAVASTAVLWAWTTPLATVLALISIAYYTLFYTGWLKRATPQNIVIGGAAGASAPLIAWSAVTGSIGLAAWVMFAIIFLWTPPHFWALAIFRKEDYASAGVPMLPVVAGERETRLQIMLYTAVMVPVTFALFLLGKAGLIYATAAVVLGAVFVKYAWAVLRNGSVRDCLALFRYSILYLLLLFATLAIDVVARPLAG